MGEREIIEQYSDRPITVESLADDLVALGVQPGSTVLVHSSLSSMGWVCGGAVAAILALETVIRPYGALVMPTHSGDLSDPSGWHHPPVPESWWDEIRKSMPPFDPEMTPTRGMGVIPETFRNQTDVVRSRHPQLSFAAWGEAGLPIVSDHALDYGLGEQSPLARIYDTDGWVLLIGVGYDSNTSFHLGEIRAEYPDKPIIPCSAPLIIDGHRRWKSYEELDYCSDDFPDLGRDFEKHYKNEIATGRIGNARGLLFRQRSCVDYATQWIHRHRR